MVARTRRVSIGIREIAVSPIPIVCRGHEVSAGGWVVPVRIDEIRFERVGEVGVRTVEDDPRPGDGEVLLAPSWIGICGSDLHLLHGRHPFIRPPVVTGHEVSARVLTSRAGGIDEGQRVLVNPLVPCGQCPACARKALNTCEAAKVLGFGLPGAARTRMVIDAEQLHRVPPDIPDELVCLAEPLATAVHAIHRADNPLGIAEVLVLGAGPIGLAVLLASRAFGAGTVHVVEPMANKRALAERLGADRTYAAVEEVPDRVCTAVLDCVGSPETIEQAARVAVAGGRIVVVGVGAANVDLRLPLARMQRFEIDLVGTGMYVPSDVEEALALLSRRQQECGALISARYELSAAAEAFEAAADPGTVKVLVRLRN